MLDYCNRMTSSSRFDSYIRLKMAFIGFTENKIDYMKTIG